MTDKYTMANQKSKTSSTSSAPARTSNDFDDLFQGLISETKPQHQMLRCLSELPGIDRVENIEYLFDRNLAEFKLMASIGDCALNLFVSQLVFQKKGSTADYDNIRQSKLNNSHLSNRYDIIFGNSNPNLPNTSRLKATAIECLVGILQMHAYKELASGVAYTQTLMVRFIVKYLW